MEYAIEIDLGATVCVRKSKAGYADTQTGSRSHEPASRKYAKNRSRDFDELRSFKPLFPSQNKKEWFLECCVAACVDVRLASN
jgi:hypothetical protein